MFIWDCPIVQEYWRKVVADVNTATNLSVSMDPKVLLLGITELELFNTCQITTVLSVFLCQESSPTALEIDDSPTVAQWRAVVDSVLPLYKLMSMGCKCPQKFDKVWNPWVTTRSLTV